VVSAVADDIALAVAVAAVAAIADVAVVHVGYAESSYNSLPH
jgi:hypothetical protein